MRFFPSSDEEGWPRHQKNIATASFDGADGVVSTRRNHFLANTTPSALRAATPPQLRRGKRAPQPFWLISSAPQSFTASQTAPTTSATTYCVKLSTSSHII